MTMNIAWYRKRLINLLNNFAESFRPGDMKQVAKLKQLRGYIKSIEELFHKNIN